MISEQELTKKIMRRVYGVYLFRQLTSPAVRTGIFLVSCIVFVSSVSLTHIVSNVLNVQGLSGLVNFFMVAAMNTTLSVQIACLAVGLLVLWAVVDITRREGSAQLSLG